MGAAAWAPQAIYQTGPRVSTLERRAALGLAEETDAAVIVVSEQTGAISVAHRGALRERLDEGALRSELVRIFRIRPQDETAEMAGPEAAGEKTADAG